MEIKFLPQLFFSLINSRNLIRFVLPVILCLIPFLGLSQSTVVVTARDNVATEATPASDTGIFEIDLGSINNTGTDIRVTFVLGGTATIGVDYLNPGATVVVPNGQRRALLTITAIDDINFEGNEEILLRLTGVNNRDFIVVGNSSSSASIILVDNDGCTTGPNAPRLSNSVVTRFCSDVEVNLSSFISSTTPPGTTLEWSTSPNPDPNNLNSFLSSSIITSGGTYYGFYFGTVNGSPCISPVLRLPTIVFDEKPSLGVPNNNNQVCTDSLQPASRRDLDRTLTGQTPGGFWNLIDGPSGQSVTINVLNFVNFGGQPEGTYTFSYQPNFATAPSCPVETIEVILYASDCDTDCDAGNRPPVLTPGLETNICVDEVNNSVDLSAYTSSTPPDGNRLVWSRNSDFRRQDAYLINTTVQSTGTFFAFFLDEENNCASPNLAVSIIFINKPEILTFTENALCSEGIMTLSATATSGSIINWYATPTSTMPLEENSSIFTTPNLTTTTTYFVEAVLNGCISDRQPVVANINNDPVVEATGIPVEACNIVGANFPTEINLFSGLTQEFSGTWALSSGPLASIAIANNGLVDFEGAPAGTYTFRFTTNTAVAPCSETSVLITVRVNECIIDTDNDTISDEDEIAIGTDPENNDTDNDGILDAVEVGDDLANPIDTDNDGIIDALDSNVLDSDMDGVVDQLDPANTNPCIPDNTAGVCDTDGDGIPDGIEIANNTDPLDACDPNLTPDCAPDPIDLEVLKEVDVLEPFVGDEIIFTITLTNLRDDLILVATIDELIGTANGFEYVSHTASKGLYDEDTGIWEVRDIQGNEINTLQIRAIVLENGDYINTAELNFSFPEDEDPTNNSASITVNVIKRSNDDCGFLFNQFSPNGDGVNDFLIINCIADYPNNTIEIFDRYGNQVYKASRYDNSWDGTGRNGELPKGTYYYVLNLGDGSTIQKGWIQIIRQ